MENFAATSVKRYQNLIFPIVAVLVGLIILGLVIIPQGLQIPQTNRQIDQVRKDLAALNQKISQLNGVDVNKYKDDLNSSLTALPVEKDIPGVIILISNLLKNNGLVLNALSFSGDVVVNGVNQFLVKIDVSGSKDGLSSLISQLKQSPRVLKVDSLTTSSSGTNTSMQILIGMNAFYQPLPASQNLDLQKPVELPTQANLLTLQQIKNYQAQNTFLLLEASSSASVLLGKPDPFQ